LLTSTKLIATHF